MIPYSKLLVIVYTPISTSRLQLSVSQGKIQRQPSIQSREVLCVHLYYVVSESIIYFKYPYVFPLCLCFSSPSEVYGIMPAYLLKVNNLLLNLWAKLSFCPNFRHLPLK